LTNATVAAWRVALEARGLGAVSVNVRITVVPRRKRFESDVPFTTAALVDALARTSRSK